MNKKQRNMELTEIQKQLVTAREIGYTYKKVEIPGGNLSVTCSKDAANFLYRIYNPVALGVHEEFYCLFLNRANRITGFKLISIGGMAGTVVDCRIIFSSALLCLASSIILCHNHPSGNKSPSKADTEITQKLKEGGKLLDLPILDHIILTEEDYFSFADEGLL